LYFKYFVLKSIYPLISYFIAEDIDGKIKTKNIMKYTIFIRRWYKDNPKWPNGLEPHMGRKTTIGYAETIEEARSKCADYNNSHNPGKYSLKAEFESN
jgi:hypothetical protein